MGSALTLEVAPVLPEVRETFAAPTHATFWRRRIHAWAPGSTPFEGFYREGGSRLENCKSTVRRAK